MDLLDDKKPYLIYVGMKSREIKNTLIETITQNIRNVEVKELDMTCCLDVEADLVIVEFDINDPSTYEKAKEISEKCTRVFPYLFVYTSKEFDESLIIPYFNSNFIFDVIKFPFIELIIINRIKTLLTIAKTIKKEAIDKTRIQESIWNVLNYSNIFAVIIDKNLNIKLINSHLSERLGYEDPEQLIGQSWNKFLKATDREMVSYVHGEISKESNIYQEFTNDVIIKDGLIITVKWFNTFINHTFNCVFSIGIPLTKEPTLDEDIDSIRSYFSDILQKDRTTITAMKEVAMRHSKRIFGEKTK